MLRKLSVTSSLRTTSAAHAPPFIQLGFDAASRFSPSTRDLSQSGKAFATHFAELILAHDVEEHHLVITPVYYTGEQTDKTANGDYFDACCLAYWQIKSASEEAQQITVLLRGFSAIDFDDLPKEEASAVGAYTAALTHCIKCPANFLVVRASKEHDVIPLLPQTVPLASSPDVQQPLMKRPRTDGAPVMQPELEAKGESSTAQKSKSIPDFDGGSHKVLDTTNAAQRRREAEFMLRLLPQERHDEMGLGVEYKLAPATFRKHITEICIRDRATLSPEEKHWASTAGLLYLENCPAYSNDATFTRFCLGEWNWDTVNDLSIKSFHRTGANYFIKGDIDSSTIDFRIYLSDCFNIAM